MIELYDEVIEFVAQSYYAYCGNGTSYSGQDSWCYSDHTLGKDFYIQAGGKPCSDGTNGCNFCKKCNTCNDDGTLKYPLYCYTR